MVDDFYKVPYISSMGIKQVEFEDVSAGLIRESIKYYNRNLEKKRANPLLHSKGHIIPETLKRLLSYQAKTSFEEIDNLSNDSPDNKKSDCQGYIRHSKVESSASRDVQAFTKTGTKTYSRIHSFMDEDPTIQHHRHDSSQMRGSLSIKK